MVLAHVRGRAACAIDLDNLCHGGFHGLTGRAYPQAQLDVLRFGSALRSRGVIRGAVCRNRPFSPFADELWRQLSFDVFATRCNCDDRVKISLLSFVVEAGFRDLILAAGDGHYTHAVKLIRACGVRVEIWSPERKASRDLVAAADAVRFIDEFLINPLCDAA